MENQWRCRSAWKWNSGCTNQIRSDQSGQFDGRFFYLSQSYLSSLGPRSVRAERPLETPATHSLRSTCRTSSIARPKNVLPSRLNFSTESVAKKLSRGAELAVRETSPNFSATTWAVDSAESTIVTCPGATFRSTFFTR